MALRDLGFTLEQIRPLLDDELSFEELQGMLRIRRAQIDRDVADEQCRLRRVQAHLQALEGSRAVQIQDVVVKKSEPVRVAEAIGSVPAFGYENVSPVFVPLFSEVFTYPKKAGVRPGINIAQYEELADDGSVVLHVGFNLGAQEVAGSDRIEVLDLPVVEVASVIHRGTMEDNAPAFEALMRWAADSGSAPRPPSSATWTTAHRTSGRSPQ